MGQMVVLVEVGLMLAPALGEAVTPRPQAHLKEAMVVLEYPLETITCLLAAAAVVHLRLVETEHNHHQV
jgi:hypothetical protein